MTLENDRHSPWMASRKSRADANFPREGVQRPIFRFRVESQNRCPLSKEMAQKSRDTGADCPLRLVSTDVLRQIVLHRKEHPGFVFFGHRGDKLKR